MKCAVILMTNESDVTFVQYTHMKHVFQINSEIANLRDLLPLPSSTRQRLSQLQLMALVLVYVRKSNYFDQGELNCFFVHRQSPIFSPITKSLF